MHGKKKKTYGLNSQRVKNSPLLLNTAIQATSEKLCHFEYLVEVVALWDEGLRQTLFLCGKLIIQIK